MVIPQTHHKHSSLLECLAHLLESSLQLELVVVSKFCLLSIAELVGDRVVIFAADGELGGVDHFTVLNVKTSDLAQISIVSAIVGNELGHHSEGSA